MEKWNEQFAMKHWDNNSDAFHLDHIRKKYDCFCVDKICAEYFRGNTPEIAIDIGGGKFGGALYWYRAANQSYLVDLLADQLEQSIHDDVKIVKADFSTLPFPDNSVDVIFAWEVFDHASSEEHFKKGILELERVLKKGGLVFLEHVCRKEPRNGHTVVVKPKQILEWLELDLLFYKQFRKSGGSISAYSYFIYTKD